MFPPDVIPPYTLSQWRASSPRRRPPHHLTIASASASEDVDPAVDRRKSVELPLGRQGAAEEGIGAAPGRELGLGASAGVQAAEDRNTHHAPGRTHCGRRACV